MFRLAPQSSSATSPLLAVAGSTALTPLTSSSCETDGASRRAACVSSVARDVDRLADDTPRCVPVSRRRRTTARVSIPDSPGTFQLPEKILEPRARLPVVRMLGQLADDERRDPRPNGLVARVGHAVVADLGVRHDHHLAAIRRVGHDLLIAGDARVEHHFGRDVGLRAEGFADDTPSRPRARARLREARS